MNADHSMSLTEYRRKRNFAKTNEPTPENSAPRGARAIFVVQLHHASTRHFDFRLQVGDALKSWAVPKGPSFDPAVKRLAVEVEDHPISYASYEGDIEEGYGKGHVDQFDTGVWTTPYDAQAQLEKGHLEFELFGQRLKGSWHLVRSAKKQKQPVWFLIKAKDLFASDLEADDLLDKKMVESTQKATAKKSKNGKSKLPEVKTKRVLNHARVTHRARFASQAGKLARAEKRTLTKDFFQPELARLRETPPVSDEWLHEVKWDGYRILTTIAKGSVNLWSRNGLPWNDRLPEIVQAITGLGLQSGQLDGELIALDKSGRTDFNGLQRTLSGEAQLRLVYMLFDLPSLEGFDLRKCSLLDRKTLLAKVLKSAPGRLSYSSHTVGDGQAAFDMATREALEGIVSKRANSGYREGRGDDWVKIKRLESDEFAVVGYTQPKGSRSGFGSLLLAKPDPDNSKAWTYVGRVGSGFTDAQLADLSQTLAIKGTKEPSFQLSDIDPQLRSALWIKPEAVVEVNYRGFGNHHLLRQPTLKTLRSDKFAVDLRNSDRAPTSTPSPNGPKSTKGTAKPVVTITHPDRVVYAEEAITKQDVADYYTAVMDWFLPGVVGRPTSVIRCPEGTAKACFFQKHLIQGLHHVEIAKLKEETGAQADYIYPKTALSILELVQFGALEFHPWGSTIKQPDQADRIVFDLDPGENVTWSRVVAAARLLRKLLGQLDLESFVRTTGGKGLHVVVPLKPSNPWPMVHSFADAFSRSLAQAHPLEFVATATKSKRKGKIYLDYLRNTKGATSVASYSLRARPGAPVATPLRWQELGKVKSGDAFTIRTLPGRLSKLRTDPWEKLDSTQQDLKHLMKALTKKGQN
jgi:bifunctional non-homologous end joining protein LigD